MAIAIGRGFGPVATAAHPAPTPPMAAGPVDERSGAARVRAPADQGAVRAVGELERVPCQQSKHGVGVPGAGDVTASGQCRRRWALCRGCVDCPPVPFGWSGSAGPCRDQSEDRLAEGLGRGKVGVGRREPSLRQAGKRDPVRQIVRRGKPFQICGAAFADRRHEVQRQPTGDEVECHITTLTGDDRVDKV